MLYREYEPETLQKLQKMELSVLKDFDQFCREHEIEYFGCGGTLLGAVRHQGFIPWDDDIDVGMTREYYEKFLEAVKSEQDSGYAVMNFREDPRFPVMITKWYKKGTVFRDQDAVTCGYHSGIAVDIFCFDNVADDTGSLRRQAMKAWIFGKLLVLRQISEPTIYAEGWKAKVMLGISRFGNIVLRLLRISPQFLYQQAEEAVTRYRGKETGRVAFLFDPTPFTSMLKQSDIYPVRELPFEGITLKFPNKPHVYARTRYGRDYMKLPPAGRRHNHPPVELSFGNEEQE